MSTDSYIRLLVNQWERQMRTADEVVRLIRETLREEDEIREAEAREAVQH